MSNSNIDLRNCDCLDLLASLPDKSVDLAIVDVPYGENCDLEMSGSRWHSKNGFGKVWLKGKQSVWNVEPPKEYFDELFRVSKNQIIWGANHFIEKIQTANSSCWLIWDKGQRDFSFADAELAWTSFKKTVRIFDYARSKNKDKIHPTQKPVALYKWLLKNYAKEGDTILDTHLGSMSSVIACYDMGFDLIGCELDKDYFDAGIKRFETHKLQQKLL